MPALTNVDIDALLKPGRPITDIPKIARTGDNRRALGPRNKAILDYLLSDEGLSGGTYPVRDLPSAPQTMHTLNGHMPEGKRVNSTTRNVGGVKVTWFYVTDAPSEDALPTVDAPAPRKSVRRVTDNG